MIEEQISFDWFGRYGGGGLFAFTCFAYSRQKQSWDVSAVGGRGYGLANSQYISHLARRFGRRGGGVSLRMFSNCRKLLPQWAKGYVYLLYK